MEKETLKSYLESHGCALGRPEEFLNGEITILFHNYDESSPEAWFNIMVRLEAGSPMDIRKAILGRAVGLFELFKRSNADINSFVVSFHI